MKIAHEELLVAALCLMVVAQTLLVFDGWRLRRKMAKPVVSVDGNDVMRESGNGYMAGGATLADIPPGGAATLNIDLASFTFKGERNKRPAYSILDVTESGMPLVPGTKSGHAADFIVDNVPVRATPLSVRGLLIASDNIMEPRPMLSHQTVRVDAPDVQVFATKKGDRAVSARVSVDLKAKRIVATVCVGPTEDVMQRLIDKHGDGEAIPEAELAAESVGFSYVIPVHEFLHQAIHVGLGEQCDGWESFRDVKPVG